MDYGAGYKVWRKMPGNDSANYIINAKEERMTTFQHPGCSFGKLVTFFAIALVWAAAACAEPASPSTPGPGATPNCNYSGSPDDASPKQDSTQGNGYVLLLFFNGDKGLRAAAKKFHFPKKTSTVVGHPTGCILDPDDNTKVIPVMGGCPTDCASKSAAMAAKNAAMAAPKTGAGDPLTRINGKHWAIFFADPAATSASGYEALNNDQQTGFRVWQIRAKNSCHAGRILESLGLKVGSDGYLGQIMIGYTNTRPSNLHPGDETNCIPWTPNGP